MLRIGLLVYCLYQWLVKGDRTWGLIAVAWIVLNIILFALQVPFGVM